MIKESSIIAACLQLLLRALVLYLCRQQVHVQSNISESGSIAGLLVLCLQQVAPSPSSTPMLPGTALGVHKPLSVKAWSLLLADHPN